MQAIVSVAGLSPYSDKRLRTGIFLLEQLREKIAFAAKDPFDLSKTFEAEFLAETALAVLQAILERKESVEPIFVRADEHGRPKPAPAGVAPKDQEIIGIRKENGRFAFRRFKGSIREKPANYSVDF